MSDVVCVGAHPDDVEIGMGGTVASMVKRGRKVTIVDLTDGEPTPFGTPEIRAEESRQAAAVLGADRITLDLPNRYLFDTVEARTALAEVLRQLRPLVLFAPFPHDAHPDHIAASAIAGAARFYAKFTKTDMEGEPHYPRRVYHYMAVHMRLVREPAFITDVTAEMAAKADALHAYRSQFGENPANRDVVNGIVQSGRMWGRMIGVESGEPFFSDEPVGVIDPLELL